MYLRGELDAERLSCPVRCGGGSSATDSKIHDRAARATDQIHSTTMPKCPKSRHLPNGQTTWNPATHWAVCVKGVIGRD
jgi:hypothetical protein